MRLGVCYYPEQWPRERWPVDAALMRQAGLSLVRIAEFAWTAMEPRDAEFTWDWLDQAIDTLAAEGLHVILGTPTASPPPWLVRAHPDILPVDAQGRRRRHGSRRHYCVNSAVYQEHTTRIVAAMAARYGGHAAVIGWQIDNEFGWGGTARCYCESCATAFRHWLEAKYKNLGGLNASWGNVFWGQTYGDWGEIEPPNLTPAEPNPSHVLDYYRFSSDSYASYQQLQLSALKSLISPSQVVTTNFMSQFTDLNYQDLARPLHFVTMSSYPTGQLELHSSLYAPGDVRAPCAYDVGDPYITGFAHTLMRGFKPDHPFWVMEQQAGHTNWGVYNTGVRPGTVRLWSWHALASGAEAVLYFRWRAGLYAQEQFHSGLLHHDATPDVGFADLEAMRADRLLMSEVAREKHEAQIALLLDYDSVWALQLQPHHRDFDSMRFLFTLYRALQRLGLAADIVSGDTDLRRYKMVIAPAISLATEQLAASLEAFSASGGTVLLGVRSGVKNESNQFTDRPLPGPFHNLAGITVADWHSLPPGVGYGFDTGIAGLVGPATVWAEALKPAVAGSQSTEPKVRVLASYTSGPFRSHAALAEHEVGSGRALYLGWHPTAHQGEALLAYLADRAGIVSLAGMPDGLLASRRGPYLILLNFTEVPLTATVSGRAVSIGPRGVEVLKTDG